MSLRRTWVATLSVTVCTDAIPRAGKPLRRAFTALCAKSVLVGASVSSVKGKNYRRRSDNTWTTITMSGLIWASICEPLCQLFGGFDMRDTVPLTGRQKGCLIFVRGAWIVLYL